MSFSSVPAFFAWLARLGASGAEDNAREAVEASARNDRLFAELDERARNGWARPAHPAEATSAKAALTKSA